MIIVDTDDETRKRIRRVIANHGNFEVVAECRDSHEAFSAVEKYMPEVIFLDTGLPDVDGFELLGTVTASPSPAVVFLSKSDEYAIQAFRIHALDYLLKPLEEERLRATLERLERHCHLIESEEIRFQMARLLEGAGDDGRANPHQEAVADRNESPPSDRIIVKDGDSTRLLRVDSIDWIQADDYYAKIHVGADHYMIRVSLNRLEELLDPARFVRIHRSTIVNVDRIAELEPWANRAYMMILKDGTQLRMSRYRRSALVDALGRTL